VTGTLLKGYKARFKGAPISSTVDYLKQYVSVSQGCMLGLHALAVPDHEERVGRGRSPISSTVDYYKQYVSASRLTAEGLVFETKPLNSGYGGMGCSGLNAVWCPAVP
jgi:hypothetical protein